MMAIVRVTRRRSQGRMRKLRNPSITICPAMVPVSVDDWPEAQQRHREQHARHRRAEQRSKQLAGLLDLRDHDAVLEEHRGGENQNRGVHEQRAVQRDGGIDQIEPAGRALFGLGLADAAGLHQRRMQIQIVRHHGGAQDSDRDVQILVRDVGNQSAAAVPSPSAMPAHQISTKKHAAMIAISDSTKLSITRIPRLVNHSSKQRIGRGEQHAVQQRNVEEQIQCDGRAQHFGQVAGRDRDLAQNPERIGNRPRIRFAAGLRQVALRHDSQTRAQSLQQDGHQVRQHQHPQQLVAEARAAFQIGGPIAGIHVADAHQVGGSGEGEHPPPERRLSGANAGMHLGQRGVDCG